MINVTRANNFWALTVSLLAKLMVVCMTICSGLGMWAGCQLSNANSKGSNENQLAIDTINNSTYRFLPDIPQMITEDKERVLYYIKHYWNAYPIADTIFIQSDDTKHLYIDFLYALQDIPATESREALQNMMERMEASNIAYTRFCELNELFLNHPNSPIRNEEYYIVVLQQMLASDSLSEAEKLRPGDHLKQALKNRPGTQAPDFEFAMSDGVFNQMSNIRTDFILLFFYNPDCEKCKDFEYILSNSPIILKLQEWGKMTILAIYPDENENEWKNNISQMPEKWVVGWDKQGNINNKQLYNILASPTLYLLNKEKTILLKDASLDSIIQYLETLASL